MAHELLAGRPTPANGTPTFLQVGLHTPASATMSTKVSGIEKFWSRQPCSIADDSDPSEEKHERSFCNTHTWDTFGLLSVSLVVLTGPMTKGPHVSSATGTTTTVSLTAISLTTKLPLITWSNKRDAYVHKNNKLTWKYRHIYICTHKMLKLNSKPLFLLTVPAERHRNRNTPSPGCESKSKSKSE